MATKFLLTQITTCKNCEGRGVTQHPAWVAYREANGAPGLANKDDDLEWFRNNDWLNKPGYRDTYRLDGLPEEEMTCESCEGDGELYGLIDLHEAMKAYEEMSKCAADIGKAECTCGWHK